MEVENKDKLTSSEVAILLGTKGHLHKNVSDGQVFEFDEDREEYVLTDYDTIVHNFLEITVIRKEHLRLEDINFWLLSVCKKLDKELLFKVTERLNSYRYTNQNIGNGRRVEATHTPRQALFIELHGVLSTLQINDSRPDGTVVPLMELDMSDMKEKE